MGEKGRQRKVEVRRRVIRLGRMDGEEKEGKGKGRKSGEERVG
jgi:hypothetical protein